MLLDTKKKNLQYPHISPVKLDCYYQNRREKVPITIWLSGKKSNNLLQSKAQNITEGWKSRPELRGKK